ncbi:SDR family NAD(P)-dependent oxidoreductase [Actinomadura sp. DC4]|uniref:SDR family NAD(P)-dependent oxidoreductase n=1 Tax=Actinomadura sp. DC4 TaxID=3055069 RepID=UPI0025B2684F|nr:SDR family NAD(P)-dependent oxidoreductase [Actinomadura sp. DC4]MDN3359645.1 SDR family NAD(P)-dependent oxidoreductase [Actinomadura sp. DC4]
MGVLDDKVAIVTGASRGIGAAIAERFAAEGATVAVTARTVDPARSRLPGTIGETVARIEAAGGAARAYAADLSDPAARESLVAAVTGDLGPADILVNNAAVTFFTPVADFTGKRYALMFEVQVTAPFHLARLVLPGMRERERGWVLNISSLASRHPALEGYPLHGGTVYGMCKAALERFTTGLASEVYGDGIMVNSLAPNRVVPTPGTVFHRLTTEDDPDNEPPAVMAEAALALCSGTSLSGRIALSQDLLIELGEG